MKDFRTSLMTLALGLSAVYMWNGLSIVTDSIPVEIPKTTSSDVLFIFPVTAAETGFQPDLGCKRYEAEREREIVGDRDMSLYDVGEFSPACAQVLDEEFASCLVKREAARRFIYEHWKKKRLGYIEVGYPCVDCGPVKHIFIEPDRNGRWQIIMTLDSNGPVRTDTASNLRFRPANKDEQQRLSSDAVLSFLDRNGNEIDYF